jgi:hypothetical protein
VQPGDAGAVRQALRRLAHDPDLVAALRAAIRQKAERVKGAAGASGTACGTGRAAISSR